MNKDDDDTLCYRSELEAEFAERLSTDIHTCHAQCQRVLCVAVRKAVAAEREACEKIQFQLRERYISQNKTAQAEIMLLTAVYDYAAAIRARGNT